MKMKLFVFAVSLAVFFSCASNQANSKENTEAVSTVSPAADTKPVTGNQPGNLFIDFSGDGGVSLSDFAGKGKYVLVDFWASWCGPCRMEIPNIAKTYEKYKGDRFDVVSVAVWDRPEDTAAAAVECGIVWNQIVNTGRFATDKYGIEGIPYIILIDPDGIIVKTGLRGSEIMKSVAEVLSL